MPPFGYVNSRMVVQCETMPCPKLAGNGESSLIAIRVIGMRELVALGYLISGRMGQRGVVGRLRSVLHVVRHYQGSGFEGLGWVPLGPKRARQGPVWSRMGLYISLQERRGSSRQAHQS